MRANDLRRIALGMQEAVEGAHMGHPDFRVDNRIFATLHHTGPGPLDHSFSLGEAAPAPEGDQEAQQPATSSIASNRRRRRGRNHGGHRWWGRAPLPAEQVHDRRA